MYLRFEHVELGLSREAVIGLHAVKDHHHLTVVEVERGDLVGRKLRQEALHAVEDERRALHHVDLILANATGCKHINYMSYNVGYIGLSREVMHMLFCWKSCVTNSLFVDLLL